MDEIERQGHTDDNFFECVDCTSLLVYLVQSRNLNEPANVVREQIIVDDPFRKLVPLIHGSAVNTDTPFAVLRI
jgi:hypothetical protein